MHSDGSRHLRTLVRPGVDVACSAIMASWAVHHLGCVLLWSPSVSRIRPELRRNRSSTNGRFRGTRRFEPCLYRVSRDADVWLERGFGWLRKEIRNETPHHRMILYCARSRSKRRFGATPLDLWRRLVWSSETPCSLRGSSWQSLGTLRKTATSSLGIDDIRCAQGGCGNLCSPQAPRRDHRARCDFERRAQNAPSSSVMPVRGDDRRPRHNPITAADRASRVSSAALDLRRHRRSCPYRRPRLPGRLGHARSCSRGSACHRSRRFDGERSAAFASGDSHFILAAGYPAEDNGLGVGIARPDDHIIPCRYPPQPSV